MLQSVRTTAKPLAPAGLAVTGASASSLAALWALSIEPCAADSRLSPGPRREQRVEVSHAAVAVPGALLGVAVRRFTVSSTSTQATAFAPASTGARSAGPGSSRAAAASSCRTWAKVTERRNVPASTAPGHPRALTGPSGVHDQPFD